MAPKLTNVALIRDRYTPRNYQACLQCDGPISIAYWIYWCIFSITFLFVRKHTCYEPSLAKPRKLSSQLIRNRVCLGSI
ncbi:hypothetical protein BT96DRAFT_462892 [Gymnopus androsaceus JB14]|uniref:Uncharacterized protein n=1 Tax=Gymnopus androsaceus JB14 TaxID=1447944 RepID=A0A6A4IJ78_9AGAR|nr:hypothetical protein BT96DRAFT_462892 [Gymnopus androsaceus JB14]